jgi:hypothetical protein
MLEKTPMRWFGSLVLVCVGCSTGGPSATIPLPSAPAPTITTPSRVAATGPAEKPSTENTNVPTPDPAKNVLGMPFPPASEEAQLMDEMGEHRPSIMVTPRPNVKNAAAWGPWLTVVVRIAHPVANDTLEIQHLQGKKKWGAPELCTANDPPWRADGTQFIKFDCRSPTRITTTKAGEFSAILSYIKTTTGQRQPNFATLRYNVIKYQASSASKNPEMAFAVDYDSHLGDAWIFPRIEKSDQHPDFEHDPRKPLFATIETWLKWDDDVQEQGFAMRCYLADEEIASATACVGEGSYYNFFKPGGSKELTTTWNRCQLDFENLAYAPALDPTMKQDFEGKLYLLRDHPGDYTCKLTNQDKIIRVMKFTVRDGQVVPSPCEKNLNTLSTTSPITVTERQGPAAYAKEAYRTNGFFGRAAWPKGCPSLQ